MGHSVTHKETADSRSSLRHRLDAVGSFFEFVYFSVDEKALIDTSLHKIALSKLYEEIMASQREWHRRIVNQLQMADYPEPYMIWNVDEAAGKALNRKQIGKLLKADDGSSERPPLYDDFCNSLDLSKCDELASCRRALFREWTEALGLIESNDVVVLDWSSTIELGSLDCSEQKIHTDWTDFFLDRLAKRVWCLTIWNPEKRTMAALAACTVEPSQIYALAT